jgi:hypothetical protein
MNAFLVSLISFLCVLLFLFFSQDLTREPRLAWNSPFILLLHPPKCLDCKHEPPCMAFKNVLTICFIFILLTLFLSYINNSLIFEHLYHAYSNIPLSFLCLLTILGYKSSYFICLVISQCGLHEFIYLLFNYVGSSGV